MPLQPPESPPGPFSCWEEVMELALEEAERAGERNEVPVGAVLLDRVGGILARASNRPIAGHDPTGHAEIRALRAGSQALSNYRLSGTVLVVTLEPCLMCVGAMIHARISGLVFGALDPKTGAIRSRLPGADLPWSNHSFWTVGGILADRSCALLQSFFCARRGSSL